MGEGPVLKWSGAKWMLADWIVEHLPPHGMYVEPYFGSGAVFFTKPRSDRELVNDLSGDVVNLFRVVRDRCEELQRAVALTPWAREEFETCKGQRAEGERVEDVERARRFLVGCWQQIGVREGRDTWVGGWRTSKQSGGDPSRTWLGLPERFAAAWGRLRGVNIERRPALDVIARFSAPDVLLYVDPPYPLSTRSCALYAYEMTDGEHVELLAALRAHPGPVVLSGYECRLYERSLAGWLRLGCSAHAQSAAPRVECLWLNARAEAGLAQLRLPE